MHKVLDPISNPAETRKRTKERESERLASRTKAVVASDDEQSRNELNCEKARGWIALKGFD